MSRESCPCEVCRNRARCGLLEVGCRLPEGPELTISVEEFCADTEIPATGGCLLAVKSGAVKTILRDAHGQSRVIDFSFPGDLIALETLADAEDSGVDYRASMSMTAVCRVRIDPTAVKRASAQFCHRLNAELATRIRANFHHRQIIVDAAQVRMAHYLMQLIRAAQGRGGSQAATLPNISRSDIASYLHLRVETVSRTLSTFRKSGWVRGPLHRLEVLDIDALASLTRDRDNVSAAHAHRITPPHQDRHG